jgi:hypothetical protein
MVEEAVNPFARHAPQDEQAGIRNALADRMHFTTKTLSLLHNSLW